MGEDCPGRQAEALIAASRQPSARFDLNSGDEYGLGGLTNASTRPVVVVARDAKRISAVLEAKVGTYRRSAIRTSTDELATLLGVAKVYILCRANGEDSNVSYRHNGSL